MNKISNYLWLAILPLAFGSCEKDKPLHDDGEEGKTVQATIENLQTKGQIQYGTDEFMWNTGDEFYAYGTDAGERYFFQIDKYDETNPSATANFKYAGDLRDGELLAFYPEVTFNENRYDMAFPNGGTQTQVQREGNSNLVHLKRSMFMYANAAVSNGQIRGGLHFEHFTTLFRIKMTNNLGSDVYVSEVIIESETPYFGRECYFNSPPDVTVFDITKRKLLYFQNTDRSLPGAHIAPNESYEGYLNFFPTTQQFGTDEMLTLTLTYTEGTDGTPQTVTKQVNLSDIARQNTAQFEMGKRYGFNMSISTPPPTPYIEVNGIKVAKGNLVADGENGAKIGEPSDLGLYFQFGSLVGWNTENSRATIAIKPADCEVTSWNADWQGNPSVENTQAGTGDPCKYYLKGSWRLPTQGELNTLVRNGGYPDGPDWTAEGTFEAGSQSYATHKSGLKLPAAGACNNGFLSNQGSFGSYWSSSVSVDMEDYAICLSFHKTSLFPASSPRSSGFSVRCIQE